MTFRLFLVCALAVAAATARADAADTLFAAKMHDLSGKPAALTAHKGKPLIVNFWARWCAPCREEMPELVKARAKYKGRGLEIVGVAIEDKGEAVRDFLKAYEVDYPQFLLRENALELMQAIGNTRAGLPFTLALDRRGKLVWSKLGRVRTNDIAAAAEAALK